MRRRRRSVLRRSSLPRGVLALPMLAAPALGAGIAYAASPQPSAPAAQNSIQINLKDRRIPYGHELIVSGTAPSSEKGQRVALDFQRAGSTHWGRISQATVSNRAHFRFRPHVSRSGRVKVVGGWQVRPAISPTPDTTPATSPARRVTVVASLNIGRHTANDYGDHVITVPGRLQPGHAGRRVRLEVLSDGHWHTGAATRTGSQGRFRLRFTPHSPWERLWVRFSGDRTNAGVGARAGTVTVFHQAVASWYEDGGSTACGYHAYYGVANLSLPCGTKVKFAYHGRTVTATVDDRGPYVGGREWDLNQNTAGALGFGGVDDVWASR